MQRAFAARGEVRHGSVSVGQRKVALEDQAQPGEVNACRCNGLRRFGSRMLHRIGVDTEPVRTRIRRVAVLARENLAVDAPAARRSGEVPMHGSALVGDVGTASDTVHLSWSQTLGKVGIEPT